MTKSPDCVFCKIVVGELPSCKLYEDGDTLAFMDIGPLVKGHALVIPKRHYAAIHDTPDPVLARLVAVARRVAQAQSAGLKAEGINIVQSNGQAAGQVVGHIHFHVIPRFNDDGHSWNWTPRSYTDGGEMDKIAATIRSSLAT